MCALGQTYRSSPGRGYVRPGKHTALRERRGYCAPLGTLTALRQRRGYVRTASELPRKRVSARQGKSLSLCSEPFFRPAGNWKVMGLCPAPPRERRAPAPPLPPSSYLTPANLSHTPSSPSQGREGGGESGRKGKEAGKGLKRGGIYFFFRFSAETGAAACLSARVLYTHAPPRGALHAAL